jgi:hypothetical protein
LSFSLKTGSLILCLLVGAVAGFAQEKLLLLQKPALSKTRIAFTFAGDLRPPAKR